MFDRRLIYHFDGFALLLMMLIVALGVTTVYSATYQAGRAVADSYAWRQALWALLGLAATLGMDEFLLFRNRAAPTRGPADPQRPSNGCARSTPQFPSLTDGTALASKRQKSAHIGRLVRE